MPFEIKAGLYENDDFDVISKSAKTMCEKLSCGFMSRHQWRLSNFSNSA